MSKRTTARVNAIDASAPIAATVAKIVPRGLDLDFEFYNPNRPIQSSLDRVNVLILPAAAWLERETSGCSGWSQCLIGDGMIAAARLLPRDFGTMGRSDPDPDLMISLRRIRNELCEWFESRQWLSSASLDFGPNGGFSITAYTEVDGYDVPVRINVRRDPDQ